jgi:hypothetical protein
MKLICVLKKTTECTKYKQFGFLSLCYHVRDSGPKVTWFQEFERENFPLSYVCDDVERTGSSRTSFVLMTRPA